MRVGLRVRAKYLATEGAEFLIPWYSASVVAVNDDGSCDVAYDDGEMERNVAADNVQVPALRVPEPTWETSSP